MGEKERERKRQIERDEETERKREREIQRDAERKIKRDRERERERERERRRERERERDRERERKRERQRDKITSSSRNSDRLGGDLFGLKTRIIVMLVLWTGPFLRQAPQVLSRAKFNSFALDRYYKCVYVLSSKNSKLIIVFL